MLEIIKLTEIPDIPNMQSCLIEFFKEWWGTENIMISKSNTSLHVENQGHTCDFVWDEMELTINYICQREIQPKEWQKIYSAIKEAFNNPVPHYYIETNGKNTKIRKKRRRQDSKVCYWIYPYRENESGWDNDVECLTIYACDFAILVEGILPIYPRNEENKSFDYTSWNEFTYKEWQQILSNWREIGLENQEYLEFMNYVVEWTCRIVDANDDVMIDSNL